MLFPTGDGDGAGSSFGTVFDTADIAATHEQLAAKGVQFIEEPTKQEWGGIQAQFADPDGNHFVLIQLPDFMRG